MAQTQREFFENAIARSGCLNDSGFARRLGVNTRNPWNWKNGKSYPSDKTMLKIALLADLDPVEALALLNLWRCDESARSTYARLLDVAQSTALRCFPYMIGVLLALQANGVKPLNNKDILTLSRVAEVSHSHHYAMSRHIHRFCGLVIQNYNILNGCSRLVTQRRRGKCFFIHFICKIWPPPKHMADGIMSFITITIVPFT